MFDIPQSKEWETYTEFGKKFGKFIHELGLITDHSHHSSRRDIIPAALQNQNDHPELRSSGE